jgi:hypothetical protein
MLYNLVIMLQRKGRLEETRRIIRHAVSLRHGEDLYPVFRLWAAFEEALDGKAALAREHLAALPKEAVKEGYLPLYAMTQLLIDVSEPVPGEGYSFQEAKAKLRSAFAKKRPCQASVYVREGYKRAVKRIGVGPGSFGFRTWALWNYRGSRWGILLAVACLSPLVLAAPPLAIPLLALVFVTRSKRE